MNKGYGILEGGCRFDVVINNHYGTHYLRAVRSGDSAQWAYNRDHELIDNTIVRRVLRDMAKIYTIHIEAPPTRPFTLEELVLPEDVTELYISERVTILKPIVLPKGIKNVEVPPSVIMANLADFIDRSDVQVFIFDED